MLYIVLKNAATGRFKAVDNLQQSLNTQREPNTFAASLIHAPSKYASA